VRRRKGGEEGRGYRGKREEGRGKKEEGRRKKDEGRGMNAKA